MRVHLEDLDARIARCGEELLVGRDLELVDLTSAAPYQSSAGPEGCSSWGVWM